MWNRSYPSAFKGNMVLPTPISGFSFQHCERITSVVKLLSVALCYGSTNKLIHTHTYTHTTCLLWFFPLPKPSSTSSPRLCLISFMSLCTFSTLCLVVLIKYHGFNDPIYMNTKFIFLFDILYFGRICKQLVFIFFKCLLELASQDICSKDFICVKILNY